MATTNPVERRRFLRAPLLGTTVLSLGASDPGRVYFIEDVSAGGVLLSGATALDVGAPVRLLLSLVGSPSIRLLARVVRREHVGHDTWRLGLEFESVPTETEASLQDRVLRALDRQGSNEPRRGLVIQPDSAERRALADDLRTLGYSTLAVEAVPEAADYLGHLGSTFAFAIADVTRTTGDAIELLALVRRKRPALKCILTGSAGAAEHIARHQRFLGQCDVLLRPWTREGLWRAVTAADGGEAEGSPG